ncbi:MAG: hypothetical protein OCD01_09565 [Fibrobacterales bacterium]
MNVQVIKDFLKKNEYVHRLFRKVLSFEKVFFVIQKIFNKEYKNNLKINSTVNGLSIPLMGIDRVHLDTNYLFEKELLCYQAVVSSEIQSLKLLVNTGDKILINHPPSALLPLFFISNIDCDVLIICKDNKEIIQVDLDVNRQIGTFTFIEEPDNYMGYSLAISYGIRIDVKADNFLLIENKKRIIRKEKKRENNYSLIKGRIIEECKLPTFYSLSCNKKIFNYPKPELNDTTKISGFSLLRNADIYPFDLCFESILEVVDEFILFVDKDYPENHGVGEESRTRLLEQFKSNSKYSDKIRIIEDVDFRAEFCKNFTVPGRWIADVNSIMIDHCKYDNCLYLMADEMIHEDGVSEIKYFASQNRYQALNHQFLHFIWDLNHIRNPENVAYTHAIRMFKKSCFASIHDGYSFANIVDGSIVKLLEPKYPIYHIGYIMDFRKKAKILTEAGGIFQGSGDKGYIEDVDTVPYNGPYPRFLKNEKMYSYKKIKNQLVSI